MTENDLLSTINTLLRISPDGILSDADSQLLEILAKSLSTGLQNRGAFFIEIAECTLTVCVNHRIISTRRVDKKSHSFGEYSIKAYENRLLHKNKVISIEHAAALGA